MTVEWYGRFEGWFGDIEGVLTPHPVVGGGKVVRSGCKGMAPGMEEDASTGAFERPAGNVME